MQFATIVNKITTPLPVTYFTRSPDPERCAIFSSRDHERTSFSGIFRIRQRNFHEGWKNRIYLQGSTIFRYIDIKRSQIRLLLFVLLLFVERQHSFLLLSLLFRLFCRRLVDAHFALFFLKYYALRQVRFRVRFLCNNFVTL